MPKSSPGKPSYRHRLFLTLAWLGLFLPLTGGSAAFAEPPSPSAGQVAIFDISGTVQHANEIESLSIDRIVTRPPQRHDRPLTEIVRFEWKNEKFDSDDMPLVILANADRLRVRPTRIDEEALSADWPRRFGLEEVRIPLETIRGVIFKRPFAPAEQTSLKARLFENSEASDRLILTNGDLALGELQALNEEHFILKSAVGEIRVDRQHVRALTFNPELTSFPSVEGLHALIELVDGSRLTITQARLQPERRLVCRTAFGAELEIPLDRMRSWRVLGGRARYLSDQEPESIRFTPYLSLEWPVRNDRNVLGGDLSLGDVTYAKGLGVHSRSEVTYRLDRQYVSFSATVGIDRIAGDSGSVIFRVLADGQEVWKSHVLRGGQPPQAVGPIDVSSTGTLTLIVDFADRGDIQDHADWADALLIRK